MGIEVTLRFTLANLTLAMSPHADQEEIFLWYSVVL